MKNTISSFNRRNFYTPSDAYKVFFLAVVAPIVLQILLSLIIVGVASGAGQTTEEISSSMYYLIPLMLSSQFCFLLIYFSFNKFRRINFKTASKLDFKLPWQNIVICAIIGIICLFGFNYIVAFYEDILTLIGVPIAGIGLPLTNFGWFILNVIMLAIIPAICEELIFRGVVLNGLMNKFKPFVAIILSALLFMLMHGNLQQAFYPFILGLILGYIAYRTGSIVCCMIVHFVNNFVVILMNYIYTITGATSSMTVPVWLNFILGIIFAIMTVAFVILMDMLLKKKSFKRVDFQKQKPDAFFYAGIAICVLLIIFSIAL